MKKPKTTTTDRGFTHVEPIKGFYDNEVRIYESSLATEPAIWLQVIDASSFEQATVRLPLDKVKELERALRYLRKNHYQVR